MKPRRKAEAREREVLPKVAVLFIRLLSWY